MTPGMVHALILASVLGCGLMAGLFFAFSICVMKALARLPARQGIAAMQAINTAIVNLPFLAVFFPTALLCAAAAAIAVIQWQEPGSGYLIAGGLTYLVGSFLVTIACNVPLNNALAAADGDSAAGTALWARYLKRWTAWNHVRTAASLAAMGLLALALGRIAPL